MCGIAGYIGRNALEDNRVTACLQSLRHRGPDDQSVYSADNGNRLVYLLNGRLSIIDLDPRSNQPFRLGSKVMTYNGELYNYVELRRALEEAGERFRTDSDTEVLLAVLTRWGTAGLDRCEGMWAFAVFDESDGSLLLCRDRFGEKPLYVYSDVDGMYFGSEPKNVAALSGSYPKLNVDHLYRYLVNGYKALYKTDATFFDGLKELAPGTFLVTDRDGRVDEQRFWEPVGSEVEMTYADAVAGAKEALTKAVEIRLRADVPLAFCMSGGVDSNALISIARRSFDFDVHGFTIRNTDERYEEQAMVDAAVEELGIRHTWVPLETKDFLGRLRALVRQHDAPVYTITYYVHWLLMEAIKADRYRISVSGSGADELFSGYFDHHLAYLQEIKGDTDRYERAITAWREKVRPLVRNPYLSNPELFVEDPGFRDHIYLNADDFAGYLHEPWQEPFAETPYAPSLLRNRMLNELFEEAIPVILHEDDRNAMSFSIENRSPFLDRSLFEFCRSIPTKHLIREGLAKAILRDAVRGIAPDAILDNPRKVGFNAPVFDLLDIDDPAVRSELLGDSPIYDHVRRDRIEALLTKRELPNSESKFLFSFLNAKIFLEEFGQ